METFGFLGTQTMPASDFADLRSQVSGSRLTGLAYIGHAASGQHVWVFKDGDILHEYQVTGPDAKRIPVNGQPAPDGEIAILKLPSRVIQFYTTIFDSPGTPEHISSGSNNLHKQMDSYTKRDTPTLLHIQWADAEGFVLIAGGSMPYKQAFFFGPAGFEEGTVAIEKMEKHPGGNCEVSIYTGGTEDVTWLGHQLNLLFEWSLSSILDRYGYLTGRIIVGAATRDLSIQAARSGWDLSIAGSRITDNTIHKSVSSQSDAYHKIIKSAIRHIETVIGLGMMTIIIRQLMGTLSTTYQTLAQRYEFYE